jgi:cell wall-associated NlpC family hydrolase
MFFLLMVLQVSCSAHNQKTFEQNLPLERQQNQKIDKTFYKLSESRKIIVQHAIDNLGRPYKWGGDSPSKGFDCSGLIVYAYQKADIDIPRTARAQFLSGKPVVKKELKPGDLVFFETPRAQKINHVGIFVGKNTFVHAPGQGRPVSYGYLTNPYFKKYYIGSRTYL